MELLIMVVLVAVQVPTANVVLASRQDRIACPREPLTAN